MKGLKKILYTVMLLATCIVASPFIFKQIWNNSETSKAAKKANKPAAETSAAETTTAVTDAVSVITEAGTQLTTIITTTEPVTEPPTEASPKFTASDASYFNDALFIGDSRTVGISEYGKLQNAAYFCSTGLTVYDMWDNPQNVNGIGSVKLQDLLTSKQFGKIYLMIGINELGYDYDSTVTKFNETVQKIRSLQPNSILYLQANLHVTAGRSQSDSIFNNANIDRFNQCVKEQCDGKTIFYIDVNPLFDDGNGNLADEYTSDNTHVLGKYYLDWCDWLCTQTIVK